MKKIITIVVLVGLVGITIFQLAKNKGETESIVFHYDKNKTIPVDVITAEVSNLETRQTIDGNFMANREVKLNADIQGKIEVVRVDLGSEVKKGQILIELDNSLLKLQLESVKIQEKDLEKDFERYRILTEADAIQKAKLDKIQLQLESAKIQRRTIEEQINKTTIRAPFDGTITQKFIEVGAFAAPGVPLLQLSQMNVLRFTAFVAEGEINQFSLNEEVILNADQYPQIDFSGKVVAIGSKANPAARYPVEIEVINNKETPIRAGMFGQVILDQQSIKSGVVLPLSVIQGQMDDAKVYVVKDGKAVLVNVEILSTEGASVLVGEGLKAGDKIVSRGFVNLFDGINVNYE
ncbi:efflux RND transporter periplasmic adaptor subunit [Brumimicrobium oceani]|uniref:Efflux RND transporter periplasmic adaptor subunit n=1 Tax=Brumimicrobium oceani TaxID=2100725 RepID=A0A2U2XD85_9FLAO|nr:efflux RND transporter periplasmic adaptor subunit [Brumimicrobium oceani]PWH85733.1 efflux RND transporter periplasmic adaptor subunit [Brumimicrobium oceani]